MDDTLANADSFRKIQNGRGIDGRLYAEGTSIRNSAGMSSRKADSRPKLLIFLSISLAFSLNVISLASVAFEDAHAEGSFDSARRRGRRSARHDVGMSEFIAENSHLHSQIDVSFQSAPLLDLYVPVEMHESYRQRDYPYRITGTATYSNFRRFDVNVNESYRLIGR